MARPRRPSEYTVTSDMTVRVVLTGGTTCLIDYVDIDLTERCWRNKDGYAVRLRLDDHPRMVRMHRVILERKLDRPLTNRELADHINGDRLDNRRSNLRAADPRQNSINRGVTSRNSTGYKGVFHMKHRAGRRTKPYAARIEVEDLPIYVSFCETAEEAAWMYDQWALALHGGYARLNFEYV